MVFPSYNGRTACLYQVGGMHDRVSYQSSSALVDDEMFNAPKIIKSAKTLKKTKVSVVLYYLGIM